jgi:hypothetical protein
MSMKHACFKVLVDRWWAEKKLEGLELECERNDLGMHGAEGELRACCHGCADRCARGLISRQRCVSL